MSPARPAGQAHLGRRETRFRLTVAYAQDPGHELLRREAARFHGVPASCIVIEHECPACGSTTHGRPRIVPVATLRAPAHVSLSRAGDLCVVAVTDAGPVGVDVEPAGAADFDGFDDVALHPLERGSPGDRTRRWVRKEALLKASGTGLSVDPREVLVDGAHVRDADVLAATDADVLAGTPGSWWLRDIEVAGHVAAVAVLTARQDALIDVAVSPAPQLPATAG